MLKIAQFHRFVNRGLEIWSGFEAMGRHVAGLQNDR